MRRMVPFATSTLPVVVEVWPERTNDLADEAGSHRKSTVSINVPVKTVSSSGGVPQIASLPRYHCWLSYCVPIEWVPPTAVPVSRSQKLVNAHCVPTRIFVFASANVNTCPGSRCCGPVHPLTPYTHVPLSLTSTYLKPAKSVPSPRPPLPGPVFTTPHGLPSKLFQLLRGTNVVDE